MIITDDSYKHELLQAPLPVLLVFTASFCGPTALFRDFLGDAKEEFAGQVIFAEVDVEDCPRVTHELQIKGTPTIMFVKAGEVIASRVGTSTFDQFCDWIDACLKPKKEGGKKK